MRNFSFFKYEALGNDFIIVNESPFLDAEEIKRHCDRHLGIGADGLFFVFLDSNTWRVKIFNADGSRASMCGNGIRCVAQWLKDNNHCSNSIKIETDSGLKSCSYKSNHWSVDMGLAKISNHKISIGNQHQVFKFPVDSELINPNLNTEFYEILSPTEVKIRVFEAGVGETLACGTGASAVTAYLVNNKLLECDQEITVHLTGGKLYTTALQVQAGLRMTMRGPARYVFKGEV